MSDNADVINGAYESFSRGDIPAVIATLDADVQWDVTESLPQGGSFQGPDAVGGFFQGLGEAWSDFSVEVEDVIEDGERRRRRTRPRKTAQRGNCRLRVRPRVHARRREDHSLS
jgi:ketosteroid isomerase-like protein